MQRWQKVGVGVIAALVVIVAAFAFYVEINWDRRYDHIEGPNLAAVDDPAVIAHGQYLVEGPAHCTNCHVGSAEEFLRADAGERVPMRGGLVFELGPLGTVYPANLTPDPRTGIGRYTDRQLFRMMRHLVKPDGTTSLWPLMPFHMMADQDLVAVVSYLRSLEPVHNPVPAPQYTLFGKVLRTFMEPFRPRVGHTPPAVAPPQAATAERGEYVARYVANCFGCHTEHDLGTMQFTGPEFAGGASFPAEPGLPGYEPGLEYRSPNLTPHPTGVLVNYPTPEAWIARFRAGRAIFSPMHWGPFSRMSDEDLAALWVYFNTLEPVEHYTGPTIVRPN